MGRFDFTRARVLLISALMAAMGVLAVVGTALADGSGGPFPK